MRALTLKSIAPRRPSAPAIRRWAAVGILAVVLAEVLFVATGVSSFCSQCGDSRLHGPLLAAGVVAWGGWLALSFRIGEASSAVAIGLLGGVHVALASYLIALPRGCVTCFTACALSLVAMASFSRGKSWNIAVVAWLASVAGTHLALRLL